MSAIFTGRHLYLDDAGTKISQRHRRVGTGDEPRQIDDRNSVEHTGHVASTLVLAFAARPVAKGRDAGAMLGQVFEYGHM